MANVVNRAANDLGLLRLGQSLQSQDQTRIEEAYNEVYAQLKEEGLANWASTDNVPNEILPYVACLMADNCLSTYAVSDSRYQRIKVEAGPEGEAAKRAIRKYVTPEYESTDEPTDYWCWFL